MQHPIPIERIEPLGGERLELPERAIDRVTVNAAHSLAALDEEFGEPACDEAFADSSLTMEHEVSRRLARVARTVSV
jgi:hypothetical protein